MGALADTKLRNLKPRPKPYQVEVMIRDYCGRIGVTIPEQGALFDGAPKTGR